MRSAASTSSCVPSCSRCERCRHPRAPCTHVAPAARAPLGQGRHYPPLPHSIAHPLLAPAPALQTELPTGLRVLKVRDGRAWVVAAGGQYSAQLTLVPAPRDDVVLAKYRPPGEEAAGGPTAAVWVCWL
jgi:hypothetical protein